MGTRLRLVDLLLVALVVTGLPWATAQERPAPTEIQSSNPQVQPQPVTPAVPDGPQPRLELSGTVYEMGEVWQGEPAEKDFTATNRGDAPLTLLVRATCGCTVLSQPKSPLEPGESTTFKISYRTDTTPGPANKRVIVSTNDPLQPQVNIEIKGNVKPLLETKPARGITFRNPERDTQAEEKVQLVNNFPQAMTLRLREGQNFGRFRVELREVTAGKEYELVATTLPPLNSGNNYVQVVLETGLKEVPQITIPVVATVMPRIHVNPPTLIVLSSAEREVQRVMQIRYKADQPFEILEIDPGLSGVKVEKLPSPIVAGEYGLQQLRVTLPPYSAIPERGAAITIRTNDPSDEFKTLTIPIRRQVVAAATGARRLGPGGVVMPAGDAPQPAPSTTPAPQPSPPAAERQSPSAEPERPTAG